MISSDEASPILGVLGPLELWGANEPVNLGGPQQRASLALLILHRDKVVSIDRMVDALWGELPPAHAVTTLRVYVSRIRKTLETLETAPGLGLGTVPGGYRLEIEDDRVDSGLFQRLVREGRDVAGNLDLHRARELLISALELWRGSPYPELEEDDRARAEAAWLSELRLVALEELGEVRLGLGEHRELVAELERLVSRHPLRERLWGQLMLAHYRSGQQPDALRTYQRVRETLVDQLGVEPTRELSELEHMILIQDERLDSWRTRPSSIPTYATSLLGRGKDLNRLHERIGTARLVSIVGPPGVGKTRLAAEVARLITHRSNVPVWWADLAAAASQADAYRALLRAFAVREISGLDPQTVVAARVRDQEGLLVVDTGGPTEEVAAPISLVLEHGPDMRVLATSQQPLRLGGEEVYFLAPLEVPAPGVSGEEAIQSDAVQLLIDRSTSGRALDEDEQSLELVSELVRRLDGIPLAIELAAAPLRTLALEDLVADIDRQVDVLAGGDPSGPPRHRSLIAAVGWSLNRLPSPLLGALTRLTAFAADFDVEGASAVIGETGSSAAAALTELADRSLLAADPGLSPSRFRMFETVRLVASSHAHGELLADARRSHRLHFRERGERLWVEMLGPDLGEWLKRGSRDHNDYLVALHGCLDAGEGDEALQLASALAIFWFRIGYTGESRVLLSQALEGSTPSSRWWGRGLAGLARLAMMVSDSEEGTLIEQAAHVGRHDPDPLVRGLVLELLATLRREQGRLAEAADLTDQLESVATAHSITEANAVARYHRGMVLLAEGDTRGAKQQLMAARGIYQGWRQGVDAGWVTVNLALAVLELNEPDEALSIAEDALKDFRARGDPRGVSASLFAVGRAWRMRGEDDRALRVLTEALELANRWSYQREAERIRSELEALKAASC